MVGNKLTDYRSNLSLLWSSGFLKMKRITEEKLTFESLLSATTKCHLLKKKKNISPKQTHIHSRCIPISALTSSQCFFSFGYSTSQLFKKVEIIKNHLSACN